MHSGWLRAAGLSVALALVPVAQVQAGGGHGHHGWGHGHAGFHGHVGERVLLGVLMGGMMGYAIGRATPAPAPRRADSYYEARPPAPRLPACPRASAPPASYSAPVCLQKREYRTRVMVGGREVDAWGTACLQPDGSWRQQPVY